MTVTKFRKKPGEIEAVQLSWATWSDVCDFLGDALTEANPTGAWNIGSADASDTCGEPGPDYIALNVRTVHGEIAIVRHGDWIIPDREPGTFYPCKPDIFDATYEPSGERSASVDMAMLDRYEVAAHQRENHPPFVTWLCRPCNHVQIIARDMDVDQSGLTLGEMAESVLDHEREAH